MHCDIKSAIYIAQNPVFYNHTMHVEVYYHLVQDNVVKLIYTPFTPLE